MLVLQNINIDLMYGLPGQTMEQWKDTLEKALALEFAPLFCIFINCGTKNDFLYSVCKRKVAFASRRTGSENV